MYVCVDVYTHAFSVCMSMVVYACIVCIYIYICVCVCGNVSVCMCMCVWEVHIYSSLVPRLPPLHVIIA